MKKFLNHAALFIGLVLISYPYLSHKIPFLPQLNLKLPLRSTDAAAWKVKPGSIYDGDTLRVVRGNEELKRRSLDLFNRTKIKSKRLEFY